MFPNMTVNTMKTLMLIVVLFFVSSPLRAQSSTIDWTNVHQIIDGFGASDEAQEASMTTANQNFFFGTGTGQLGLSILRVGVTNGVQDPGSCLTVSTSCAGAYISDMQAVIANGGRVYATPWSPPAAYKTNGSTTCTGGSGSGALATASYANYAAWLANFVKSLQTENGISLYALSVQNEPDFCPAYDGALWTASQFDTFIKTNLGPTFASAGLSTLIFMPETSEFSLLSGRGNTCLTDSACYNYLQGINFHEYGATANAKGSIGAAINPWASLGKKYWSSEGACGPNYGPTGCERAFNTDMTTDGLMWAGLIDDRMVKAGVNAFLYWQFIDYGGPATSTNDSLMSNTGVVAKRAYVFGQYSEFVRPDYYRIDATHVPQAGVSVSAYQNVSAGKLVIVATNYTGSAVSQNFSITNAPPFSSVTPYITSTSLSLAAQTSVPVSANSFTYTLPAGSVTTFLGTVGIQPPTNIKARPF
jgi:glucuronoarabinoxylan endo-1,4-beta-xylanase